MSETTPFTVAAADVQDAVNATLAGLKWFGDEARLALAWIDKSVPGAQPALAELFQVADAAAMALEAQATGGLGEVVGVAIEDAGATLARLIATSGLDLAAKATLSAADVATVSAARGIAQDAISVAAARLLGNAARVASANQASIAAGAAPASGG